MKIKTITKKILADTITPVSLYLNMRDIFPNSVLLESSDYHSSENSHSILGIKPEAFFMVENSTIQIKMPDKEINTIQINPNTKIVDELDKFIKAFEVENNNEKTINGFLGYMNYDAVRFFEKVEMHQPKENYKIPDIFFSLYKYLIVINHYQDSMTLVENIFDDGESEMSQIETLIKNRNFATYGFSSNGAETSNITDKEYMQLITKGKEHCYRGDVFQIVLSRQFSQSFKGDEFNVYRALRSINPSPYLFYFDFGNFKIFGSSPEIQLQIKNNKAYIDPIAGTFKRTGDDDKDKELALKLLEDKKENAEHIMLVDLARNDLARNAQNIKVETFRQIQFYSHVLHMVSRVSGEMFAGTNPVKVLADTFPAGTLSGAPKVKAMELINRYENQNRGFYGGCIGLITFNGDLNTAITIRTFMSKDNCLYFQAGAGIVADSNEESELNEMNNKLAALRKAIEMATSL